MRANNVLSATTPAVVLAPAAPAFAVALADGGPPLKTLSPDDARAMLNQAQSGSVAMAAAEIEDHTNPGGPDGTIPVTVVRLTWTNGGLPAVVYTHGGIARKTTDLGKDWF